MQTQKTTIMPLLLLITLSIACADDPIETRYMRSDQHTINGLTAYKFDTSQTTSSAYNTKTELGVLTCYWGIRVWKRANDETETEITSGTPAAQVSRSTNTYGLQSNSWNCPQTNLATTDAIVVRVYTKLGAGIWQLCTAFITEQLGAQCLNASTWTVYYYTKRQAYNDGDNDWTASSFWWGTGTYNSRIQNFTWTQASPELPAPPQTIITTIKQPTAQTLMLTLLIIITVILIAMKQTSRTKHHKA